ncbi:MAG TPA: hypothetical protein PLZ93_18765, partial [Nocardioides sp.]|nr:hypothetical protein [Nocardioides sp.]
VFFVLVVDFCWCFGLGWLVGGGMTWVGGRRLPAVPSVTGTAPVEGNLDRPFVRGEAQRWAQRQAEGSADEYR